MNKEIIVKLLHKDISELAQLTQGFDEMETLPAVLVQLARQKAAAIVENLQYLDNTAKPATATPQPQAEPEHIQPAPQAQPEPEVVPEPEPQQPEIQPVEPEIQEAEAQITVTETVIETQTVVAPANETTSVPETASQETDEPEETPAEEATEEPEHHAEKHFFQQQDVVTRNDSLQHKVSDVKQAISIGDRFLFQRELFDGSGELLSKTITAINACQTLEAAEQYLAKKFHWNPDNPATERFMQIVRRKF